MAQLPPRRAGVRSPSLPSSPPRLILSLVVAFLTLLLLVLLLVLLRLLLEALDLDGQWLGAPSSAFLRGVWNTTVAVWTVAGPTAAGPGVAPWGVFGLVGVAGTG